MSKFLKLTANHFPEIIARKGLVYVLAYSEQIAEMYRDQNNIGISDCVILNKQRMQHIDDESVVVLVEGWESGKHVRDFGGPTKVYALKYSKNIHFLKGALSV